MITSPNIDARRTEHRIDAVTLLIVSMVSYTICRSERCYLYLNIVYTRFYRTVLFEILPCQDDQANYLYVVFRFLENFLCTTAPRVIENNVRYTK